MSWAYRDSLTCYSALPALARLARGLAASGESQLESQTMNRLGSILFLAPTFTCFTTYACRQMSNRDGCFHFVPMLSSGPGPASPLHLALGKQFFNRQLSRMQ